MEGSVINNPLKDNKFPLKFFRWEGNYLKLVIVHTGEKCSLRNSLRMQNTELVG